MPWETAHQRSPLLPVDLLDQVEAEMRRSGRSPSWVITDALWEQLSAGPPAGL